MKLGTLQLKEDLQLHQPYKTGILDIFHPNQVLAKSIIIKIIIMVLEIVIILKVELLYL